jgi:hypothetical protein
MHLSGWQRIAVIASVCWFIGGGALIIDYLVRPTTAEYGRCLDAHSIQPDGTWPRDTDWGPCTRRFETEYIAAVADHWQWAALCTLLPIPTIWLLVYGLVALMRWTKAAFPPRRLIDRLAPRLGKRPPTGRLWRAPSL